ncbi:extracellular solute-binding protein [Paenibacillus sp. J5C_2022]|uniref:extracellular solute-binding protein n=1 Tax=Paenibacillus sp. J5C2022 TaxID=2977129 RepID=UPI0021D39226|nr:extracellular solute-binding protein [Paenibacillus sp. J5C2022]MCU6712565.1 extracellular solute-binding protein [Paenibacillus sp. J5C2022]
MKTNYLSLVVVVVMLLSLIVGCSNNSDVTSTQTPEKNTPDVESNLITEGMKIVKNPIQLKFATAQAPTTAPDWNTVKIWQEFAKMTNVNVEWDMMPTATLKEKLNLMLVGGDYPDGIYGAGFSGIELAKYGGEGTFIRLNDLIDQYAPNLKKLFEEYPEVKKALTMVDGNIYSFPGLSDPTFVESSLVGKVWLKKELLDSLGLQEPKTVDEFYHMLKTMKESDPEVIPYAGVGVGHLINYLQGAWGLGNRGTAHGTVDLDPETNKLRFIQTDPKYKELLQFMNKLYTEGLLNKDIFTTNSQQFYATGATGVYGSTGTSDPSTLMKQDGYVGSYALTGPYGDHIYSGVYAYLYDLGAFVITDKNKNPAETVRWMDNFYTDEFIKMYMLGFEGESYEETTDGKYDYLDEIYNDPSGLTYEQALLRYVVWPGGRYPGRIKSDFIPSASSPQIIEATDKIRDDLIENRWPAFTFTEQESKDFSAVNGDISAYLGEMVAKFITGDASFTEWGKYIENLNSMGLEKYMEIYTSAYERFENT